MNLCIVHLYPRELGINGDVGNVDVLVRRAAAHGHTVEVVNVGRGDDLPQHADLVHIGSGPLSAIESVLPDVARHAVTLRSWREAGVPFLAISGGWQVLGRSLVTEHGRTLEGAGVFPSRAVRGGTQAVEETVLATPRGTVTGFANHNAITTLEQGAASFGQVVKGFGNAGVDSPDAGLEGVVVGDSIGTHLHGPVLALNPSVADELLAAALRRAGRDNASLARAVSADEAAWLERVDGFSRHARAAMIARTGASASA